MTRKTVPLTLPLPADTLATLQAIADRAGCSIDVVVRVCLAREVIAMAVAQSAAAALIRRRGEAK